MMKRLTATFLLLSLAPTTDAIAQMTIERTVSGLSAPLYNRVGGLVHDGSTNRLYVHQSISGVLLVIDPDNGQLLESFQLQGGDNEYRMFAFDAASRRIYAGNNTSDERVFIHDANTGVLLDSWPGSVSYGSFAFNQVTGFLYQASDYLVVFDPTQPEGNPVRLISGGYNYGGVAINLATNVMYGALPGVCQSKPEDSPCLNILAIDLLPGSPSFHAVVADLRTDIPFHMPGYLLATARVAVDRGRNRVYIGNGTTVWTLDANPQSPTFHQILAATTLSADPRVRVSDVTVNPLTSRVYVMTYTRTATPGLGDDGPGAGQLFVLDGTTGMTVNVMNLPGQYMGGSIAVDPVRDRVFVAPGWYGPAVSTGIGTPSDVFVVKDSVATETAVAAGIPSVTSQATIQFDQVIAGGTVSLQLVEPEDLPAPLPGQFSLDGAVAYEITTTAAVQGPITICFNASHVNEPTAFAALRVLHGENGSWVDRTVSRDFASGSICAQTSSLSPFVVTSIDVDYEIRALYDPTRAAKAGSTMPLKIQLIAPWGANLSASDVVVKATGLKKLSSSASYIVQDAGQSNADNDFRFDPAVGPGGGYIYNLLTKGLSVGTYELEFTATGDGRVHRLRFQVR